MKIIDDEVGLKEKPEDTRYDYIEIRPQATRVRANDSIPNFDIIGNCGLRGGGGGGYRCVTPEGT